jgi:hypothetical protein
MDDFNNSYRDILRDCISMLDRLNELEWEQINLAITVGQKVDQILGVAGNDSSVIQRLARDISRQRDKLFTTNKLEDYRSIYLSFQSLDQIKKMSSNINVDISTEKIVSMTRVKAGKAQQNDDTGVRLVKTLRQMRNLLKKLLTLLGDCTLSLDEKARVIETLSLLRERNEILIRRVELTSCISQLDLFSNRPEDVRAA